MRLIISHVTTYDYDIPVPYALQQVRLTPKTSAGQSVIRWQTRVIGGRREVSFEDSHRNTVELISFDPGTLQLVLHSQGEVEMRDMHGIVGQHGGFMPLWMFERQTPLTKPGPLCRKLANAVSAGQERLALLHDLSRAIHAQVAYVPGRSSVASTAEDALEAGHGVCQDHAHVFLACARHLGVPARYVSGYLAMDAGGPQDATHAWAEAHVPDLGWVGFDVSNGIAPDMRYVRIATGLDYAAAAPVSGRRYGAGAERLTVQVDVQQQ